MSEPPTDERARREQLLDRIQQGAGGGATVRQLYADAAIGQLEAAVARVDEALANAAKPGGRLAALWRQGKITPV